MDPHACDQLLVEIQKGQGLGSGHVVSRVYMAELVVCIGVQIPRDNLQLVLSSRYC